MGQDPDAIREEIEDTRERMGDTVDALGYKADVKSRAKENIADKVAGVKGRFGVASDRVSDATPDSDQVKRQAERAAGVAQENPLGLAIGGVAVGFLAGMLIPETAKEHEKLGPAADRVKEQAAETGREALERGKSVAQSAAQSAAETAKEEGREHGQALGDSAKESASAAASEAGSTPSR
jgi:hypothetical protein